MQSEVKGCCQSVGRAAAKVSLLEDGEATVQGSQVNDLFVSLAGLTLHVRKQPVCVYIYIYTYTYLNCLSTHIQTYICRERERWRDSERERERERESESQKDIKVKDGKPHQNLALRPSVFLLIWLGALTVLKTMW